MRKSIYAHAFLTMALIMTACSEKTKEITIKAINGEDGKSGNDGKDGVNCSVSKVDDLTTVTCGDSVVQIEDGKDGIDGVSGENGIDGQDAVNCTVSKVDNVATITCPDSEVQVIDGQNGTNASGVSIVQFINPCGSNWSNDELILRLSNGQLLAVYDGGPNEDRLTLLAPGSYHTTDHNNVNKTCNFTIDSNLTLTDNNGNIYTR